MASLGSFAAEGHPLFSASASRDFGRALPHGAYGPTPFTRSGIPNEAEAWPSWLLDPEVRAQGQLFPRVATQDDATHWNPSRPDLSQCLYSPPAGGLTQSCRSKQRGGVASYRDSAQKPPAYDAPYIDDAVRVIDTERSFALGCNKQQRYLDAPEPWRGLEMQNLHSHLESLAHHEFGSDESSSTLAPPTLCPSPSCDDGISTCEESDTSPRAHTSYEHQSVLAFGLGSELTGEEATASDSFFSLQPTEDHKIWHDVDADPEISIPKPRFLRRPLDTACADESSQAPAGHVAWREASSQEQICAPEPGLTQHSRAPPPAHEDMPIAWSQLSDRATPAPPRCPSWQQPASIPLRNAIAEEPIPDGVAYLSASLSAPDNRPRVVDGSTGARSNERLRASPQDVSPMQAPQYPPGVWVPTQNEPELGANEDILSLAAPLARGNFSSLFNASSVTGDTRAVDVNRYSHEGAAAPSRGSVGHPYSCNLACKFYGTARGCKEGEGCMNCHICHWKRCYRTTRGKQTALLKLDVSR